MPPLFARLRLRTQLTLSFMGLAAFVALLSFLLEGTGAARPIGVGACTLALAVLLGWWVGRAFTDPLAKLREAVTAIGREKWNVTLPRSSSAEFGEVAEALELMKQSMLIRLQEAARARGRLADDVADRDRQGRATRRAQKMEAIGRLAGGIAHEFNNMLSIVLGYSGIALDGLRPEDPLFLPLSEIKHAGERSAELTRRLLAMSCHQVLETKVHNAVSIVEGMARSMRRVLGDKNELEVLCESSPCRVDVARAQIEQVVMNLVLNAREAMPEGGKVTIDV